MSSTAKKRAKLNFEKLLYDFGTINRTDYRFGDIVKSEPTEYQPRPSHYVRPKHTDTFVHTMNQWKCLPPMEHFYQLKMDPIIRGNPHKMQQEFTEPVDEDRASVQASRPRVVMTPQCSLDDVPEPDRARIIKDMYISTMKTKAKEAVREFHNVRAPFPGHPAPARPIRLPRLSGPYVHPEWRKESTSWDARQLRAYCDPTEQFWLQPSKAPTP